MENTLYQKIETAIIRWNIDGTKTAGTLTREILEIMEPEKDIFEQWDEERAKNLGL